MLDRKNKHLPFAEFRAKAKAPIKHLFGKYEWCDCAWCYSNELDIARDQLRGAAPIAEVINPAESDSMINPAESSDSGSSLDAVPTAATAPPRLKLPLVESRS